MDDIAAQIFLRDGRQIFRRIMFEFFEKHAVLGDLAERLTIGGT